MIRRLIIALFALIALTPSLASACWDGLYATGNRITIRDTSGGHHWTPKVAREIGVLLLQADALLPHGVQVEVDFGEAETCEGPDHCQLLTGVTLDNLLPQLAEALSLPPESLHEATRITGPVYTLRVKGGDRPGELARQINDSEVYLHGNLEIGGFPANNPQAVVMANGEVWVGTFIDTVDVKRAIESLKKMGVEAVPHPLGGAAG